MIIDKTRYVFEGDQSPDTETKAFIEMDMSCRNKECANYKQIVETIKNPIG